MKVSKEIKQKAEELYREYSGNHPTIHCNRFPAWYELSKENKKDWYNKAFAINCLHFN